MIYEDELCDSCKEFDKVMNGGPASLDILVVCTHHKNHVKDKDVIEAEMKSMQEEEENSYSYIGIEDLKNRQREFNKRRMPSLLVELKNDH